MDERQGREGAVPVWPGSDPYMAPPRPLVPEWGAPRQVDISQAVMVGLRYPEHPILASEVKADPHVAIRGQD